MKKAERKRLEEHDKQVLKDREKAWKPQWKQLEKWAKTYANKTVDDKFESFFTWLLIGLSILFLVLIFIKDPSITLESFLGWLVQFLLRWGVAALIIWWISNINGDTLKIIWLIILFLIVVWIAIAVWWAIWWVAWVIIAIIILKSFHII